MHIFNNMAICYLYIRQFGGMWAKFYKHLRVFSSREVEYTKPFVIFSKILKCICKVFSDFDFIIKLALCAVANTTKWRIIPP